MSSDNVRHRELKYFSWVFSKKGFTEYRERTYDPLMQKLAENPEKYNMVFDILDYKCAANEKVGKITRTPFDLVIYLAIKSMYELKQIRHKWMMWAEYPNIHHTKLFDGFEG